LACLLAQVFFHFLSHGDYSSRLYRALPRRPAVPKWTSVQALVRHAEPTWLNRNNYLAGSRSNDTESRTRLQHPDTPPREENVGARSHPFLHGLAHEWKAL